MFFRDKDKKDGRCTICKECKKDYYLENKEFIAKYNKQYIQDNKEWARVRKSRSRNARIDYYRWLRREWTRKNPDKNKEHKKKDYNKHKDKYIQRAKNRRVKEKSLLADLTPGQWRYTLDKFKGECAYCGSLENITQEHIIPVDKLGEYTLGNIIPACFNCNRSKSNNDLKDWFIKQKFYCENRVNKIEKFAHGCANQSGRLDTV